VEIVTTAARMKAISREARDSGLRLGFVPTMGALHAGHLSLFTRARAECDLVVVSIYVNPLQFGPGEDFERYPRDLERDEALARQSQVDVLFVPDEGEIHLLGHRTRVEIEGIQDALCGRSRPGHFRGVATVVAKLLAIVRPGVAYFGEKDAQQLRLIRRMARDLHEEAEIRACPTVRAEDGLALSSRNACLSPEERRAAPVLRRALLAAAGRVAAGETHALGVVEAARAIVAAEPLARLDYLEAVDDETLVPVSAIRGRVLLAVAARFGRTRLIDNIVLEPPAPQERPGS
jgi:pantoate--beta-alanine ligase